MTASRWMFVTLTTIATVIGFVAAMAYALDPYGVLRDPAGRQLRVYDFERHAKFFMNRRYVPSNFNGLLIGDSAGANWDVPVLDGARIYNDSLPGGNAVEGEILVNQALRNGRFKLVVVLLSPGVTRSHLVHDGLDTFRFSEVIASIPLLYNELAGVLRAANIRFRGSDAAPDGEVELPYHKNLYQGFPPGQFAIDPSALSHFQGLVNALRSQGATIVYVVPPVYEPLYQRYRPSYEAWLNTVLPSLPTAPVIDLNAPEYADFRSDPGNFIDPVHLEPKGAAEVAGFLAKLVPEAVASGK